MRHATHTHTHRIYHATTNHPHHVYHATQKHHIHAKHTSRTTHHPPMSHTPRHTRIPCATPQNTSQTPQHPHRAWTTPPHITSLPCPQYIPPPIYERHHTTSTSHELNHPNIAHTAPPALHILHTTAPTHHINTTHAHPRPHLTLQPSINALELTSCSHLSRAAQLCDDAPAQLLVYRRLACPLLEA